MLDNSAVFKITYGLFVLSARDGDKDNGCIINTLMQQTSTPLTVSVSVNKANKTHDMILKTGLFNVSVLTEKCVFNVIKNFGFQSGSNADKFMGFPNCARGNNGVFYVTDFTNAFLSGKVIKSVDMGTHTWFLAEVTEAEVFSEVPSLTYGYYQKNIKPAPAAKPIGKTVWRCKVCGYEHEGETLPADFVCPLCKHGADDFEKVSG